MQPKLTAATAVFAALTFGSLGTPTLAATSDVAQPWAESGSAPQAAPTPQRRGSAINPRSTLRTDAPAVIDSGEAAGSVERPRPSAKTRAQVRRENRAARLQRRSADGWEQVGGEGGTRTGPK